MFRLHAYFLLYFYSCLLFNAAVLRRPFPRARRPLRDVKHLGGREEPMFPPGENLMRRRTQARGQSFSPWNWQGRGSPTQGKCCIEMIEREISALIDVPL